MRNFAGFGFSQRRVLGLPMPDVRTSMAFSVALLVVFVMVLAVLPGQGPLAMTHSQEPQTLRTFQEDLLAAPPPPQGNLKLVQAVFRHGARTPLSNLYWPQTQWTACDNVYPGVEVQLRDETGLPDPPPIIDLDTPKLPGTCRMGQLTRNGYGMAVSLGTWLRRRYVTDNQLLPQHFEPSAIAMRTTCVQRAMQTLQGVVTGLYPKLSGPVVANASRERFEFLYGRNTTCPRLAPLQRMLVERVAARDGNDSALQRQARRVQRALSLNTSAPLSWLRLHDTLVAMRADNKGMPKGLTQDLAKMIYAQAVRDESPVIGPTPSDGFLSAQECQQVWNYEVGPLAWRLVNNMRRAADEVAARRPAAVQRGREAGHAGSAAAAAVTSSSQQGDVESIELVGDGRRSSTSRKLLGMLPRAEAQGVLPQQQGTGKQQGQQQHRGAMEGAGAGALSEDAAALAAPAVDAVAGGTAPAGPGTFASTSGSASSRGAGSSSATLGSQEAGPAPAGLAATTSAGNVPLSPSMVLYSGHDSTITPLLAMLGEPETSWPPYTASLVFELWEVPLALPSQDLPPGEPAIGFDVRALYLGRPMELKGSRPGGWLTLAQFHALLQPSMTSDEQHQQECGWLPGGSSSVRMAAA